MKQIEVSEFLVTQGEMQAFTSAMQTWERLAMRDENGPEQHAVLVNDENACLVTAVTQFASAERAAAFRETGLGDELLARVSAHCDKAPVVRHYSLYYEAGPEGPDVVFGQDVHESG
ncbi:MAG: hypothetical protein HKO63_12140 [Acidimicrobiia bacterium]|nr:hypothetical protein [Acidimicrobiia bacterium]NNF87486.1 hypothetical protein [Acidimicrobiia bacterium]NNL13428.1 hypothetical protein [Acidimicrobiia bacterium]NNL48620.1 hypothetical protein [Acidimicrobiia bacterium]NNL98942.1 hypothetical protein [Acidimicrobiia bacterium]